MAYSSKTMKLLTSLLLLLTCKGYSQQSFEGTYYRYTKGGGFNVQINNKGSYNQKMGDCTWGFKSKGKWTSSHDTIYLQANKLYGRSGSKLSLTIPTATLEDYQHMNKLFFRNDTLFVVYKGKLRYPMLKKTGEF